MKKREVAPHRVRAWLEPGPIVLISSAHEGARDVMTHGWHTVLEFSPSLVGCMISAGNHSFGLIRAAGECVINLPTVALADTVVGIGNCSGANVDKFARFALATEPGDCVAAPRLTDCFANFECRLVDDAMVDRYNFFVFEVVKALVAPRPRHPETLHYCGDGVFLRSGRPLDKRRLFRPAMLGNGR